MLRQEEVEALQAKPQKEIDSTNAAGSGKAGNTKSANADSDIHVESIKHEDVAASIDNFTMPTFEELSDQ